MFDMNSVWNTPKEYNELVKVLGFAAGSMENAENTSAEMQKAYEDVAKMCQFFLNVYEKKQK